MSATFNPSDARQWRAARVDNAAIRRRVARVRARSIKTDSKDALLRMALSMVDLTTLEGRDTPQRVFAVGLDASGAHASDPSAYGRVVYACCAPLACVGRIEGCRHENPCAVTHLNSSERVDPNSIAT